jgi:predicted enzyme related to lactoylglutathione lyase
MSSHLPGKFIWFEHASADTAKARSFYERLFDWHVEAMPMGDGTYDMLMNGGAGIGGLVDAKAGTPTAWQSYISVPDVDAAYRAALAAGAASVAAPADFPPVGRGATIVDPTGATVSLWKSTQGDRPDPAETPVGSWYWNELLTSDAQKALAFYAQVFGYTHEAMDMGQPVPYIVLNAGGKPRGGIYQAPQGAPTQWLPYVRVADCDATADRATQLGARLCQAPTDIPNVGRFASIVDPLGAQVAFIKGSPAM